MHTDAHRLKCKTRRRWMAGAALCALVGITAAAQKWPPKPLPGYNIFNDQQEVWLGELLEVVSVDAQGVLDDAEATAYLQALGERLAAKSKRPELHYQFFLYDRDEVDAFALPGGRIYVTRGMIRFCQNEAELAGVLSHEIAHVALRQGAKTFSRWLFWDLGVTEVGDKDDIRKKLIRFEERLRETNGFQMASDLLFGIMRGDEMFADKYGIWNLHEAGYEPTAIISLFRRYDAEERENEPDDPWIRLLQVLFSSHPPSGDRAKLLEMEASWMRKRKDAVVDTEEFRRFKARVAAGGAQSKIRESEKR